MKFDPTKYKVENLPLEKILFDDQFNVRGPIELSSCMDLAEDIKSNGLDQPIQVRAYTRKPGYDWQAVAGHRRGTAFKINKETHIPAFIRTDLDDDMVAAAANIRENVQREGLNIMQEAKRVGYLLRGGIEPAEVARMVGKTLSWVKPRAELIQLPHEVQDAAYKGIITQSHIGQLFAARKDPLKLAELLRQIKHQHEAGEKVIVLKEERTSDDVFRQKKPNTDDVLEIRKIIYDLLTSKINQEYYLPHVLLSWTLGHTSMINVIRRIEEECDRLGLDFELPPELQRIVDLVPGELQAA
jgi:ParB/RepB/Spo0J family partition protein